MVVFVLESHVADLIIHPQFDHHVVGDFIRFAQVVCCPIRHCPEEMFFCTSAAKNEADPIDELRFGIEFVFVEEILCKT